jgi:predicted membrane-bound dolichyl-phosphate-mannose-protein mannosyltransferase
MKKQIEKNYKLIVAAILLFMGIVSILNAWWDTAIFDETAHIPAGYSYLTRHEMRLNPEHPPLIKDLAGLPLVFMNLNFDTTKPFWTGNLPRKWDEGQWTAGRHLLWEAGNNPDKIILWSRLPIILLSLVLGLFIFRWARELTSVTGGLFALTLYAFDPNILGHNHFVTTDLGIAAFMLFAFYYYLKFIKHPSWKNVFLAGLFVGLLQLAKFSSILAFPVF